MSRQTSKKALFIPTVLRAAARAVNDVDPTQFPELYAAPGTRPPPVPALQRVTTEINDDVPLSAYDFRLFQAAYASCRQHLRCVSREVMASGTPVSEVLTLTTCIDARCSEVGVPVVSVFPQLQEVHNYVVMVNEEFRKDSATSRHGGVFDRLIIFLGILLHRALAVMDRVFKETQAHAEAPRTSTPPSQLVVGSSPGGTTSVDSTASHRPHRKQRHASNLFGESQSSPIEPDTSSPTPEVAVAGLRRSSVGALLANLSISILNEISSINADVAVHLAHVRWYVTVCGGDQELFFDAANHLDDLSMVKLWGTCIGSGRPACPAEDFADRALHMFSERLWEPVMQVLNFKNCGVVSLFSVQRLLKVWGPLLLLDRNLGDDVRGGMLCLSQPFEYLLESLPRRPDARAGDYVVGLTETPGVVQVAVLRSTRPVQGHVSQQGSWRLRRTRHDSSSEVGSFLTPLKANQPRRGLEDVSAAVPSPLITTSYRFSQETGAWTVQGLTREEFETITAACLAFPELFMTPLGEPCGQEVDPSCPKQCPLPAGISGGAEESMVYSVLNRACFRNNSRYVKTLLTRGAGTTVNTAVTDPSVSPHFCWPPLLCAVNNPNSDPSEIVALLLASGADVTYRDEADCTALYYTIANRYAATTRLLLEHTPTLMTSPSTHPLLVALGAHHFLPNNADVRRLTDVIPSPAVMEALSPLLTDIEIINLAVDILQDKLNGLVRLPADTPLPAAMECSPTYTWDRHTMRTLTALFPAGGAVIQLRTPEEEETRWRLALYHSRLCKQFSHQVETALRVLRGRSYALSWERWLSILDEREAATKGDGSTFASSRGT